MRHASNTRVMTCLCKMSDLPASAALRLLFRFGMNRRQQARGSKQNEHQEVDSGWPEERQREHHRDGRHPSRHDRGFPQS